MAGAQQQPQQRQQHRDGVDDILVIVGGSFQDTPKEEVRLLWDRQFYPRLQPAILLFFFVFVRCGSRHIARRFVDRR